MKLNFSLCDWLNIGKSAGWIRKDAQAETGAALDIESYDDEQQKLIGEIINTRVLGITDQIARLQERKEEIISAWKNWDLAFLRNVIPNLTYIKPRSSPDYFQENMAPGQKPYSAEEKELRNGLVSDAALAQEKIPADELERG